MRQFGGTWSTLGGQKSRSWDQLGGQKAFWRLSRASLRPGRAVWKNPRKNRCFYDVFEGSKRSWKAFQRHWERAGKRLGRFEGSLEVPECSRSPQGQSKGRPGARTGGLEAVLLRFGAVLLRFKVLDFGRSVRACTTKEGMIYIARESIYTHIKIDS